ncbi:DUF6300 family protein [Streptomyces sp. NPDC101733]|uniref:DUF6300 family protein n=1 Tax=unclassified Streptomyces TaxID=2593676 RepID=UPI0034416F8C
MDHVELSDQLPRCSRCRGDLVSSIVMPQDDAEGWPIHLELCWACDVDKPAAGALLGFFAEGGGRDIARVEEAARLLIAWTDEGMAGHGFLRQDPPPEE